MKKSVWIFLLAVFLPGAVLGWLALRGVEEQQIVFERRTAELYQKETEALAASVREAVEAERRAFGDAVHRLLARSDAEALSHDFTNTLADVWPRKAIGFALSPDGNLVSPSVKAAAGDTELRNFLWDNGAWLCSTQPAVVYRVPIDNKLTAMGNQMERSKGYASNLDSARNFNSRPQEESSTKAQDASPTALAAPSNAPRNAMEAPVSQVEKSLGEETVRYARGLGIASAKAPASASGVANDAMEEKAPQPESKQKAAEPTNVPPPATPAPMPPSPAIPALAEATPATPASVFPSMRSLGSPSLDHIDQALKDAERADDATFFKLDGVGKKVELPKKLAPMPDAAIPPATKDQFTGGATGAPAGAPLVHSGMLEIKPAAPAPLPAKPIAAPAAVPLIPAEDRLKADPDPISAASAVPTPGAAPMATASQALRPTPITPPPADPKPASAEKPALDAPGVQAAGTISSPAQPSRNGGRSSLATEQEALKKAKTLNPVSLTGDVATGNDVSSSTRDSNGRRAKRNEPEGKMSDIAPNAPELAPALREQARREGDKANSVPETLAFGTGETMPPPPRKPATKESVAVLKKDLPGGGLTLGIDTRQKNESNERSRAAESSATQEQRMTQADLNAAPAQLFNTTNGSFYSYLPSESQSQTVPQQPSQQQWAQKREDYAQTVTQNRGVEPMQVLNAPSQALSSLVPSAAEFRVLTAMSDEGMVSRFVQDKLDLIFWIRPPEAPEMIFGCLVEAGNLQELWPTLLGRTGDSGNDSISRGQPPFILALLDDKAKPMAMLPTVNGTRDWKRPFVASEIGEALPHWEAALYLAQPGALAESARGLRRTLSFTVVSALALIILGAWLVVADIRRQLALAQQKTDFVSNVSHELKTPLTSIRMFAELMHDRPPPVDKQGQYLRIITVEAERLTRLINNVLDFAKLERRQKRFDKRPLDLHQIIARVWEGNEMHLRDAGFTTRWQAAPPPYPVLGDEDALSQILVNLLSNAEKYSPETKEVELHTWSEDGWLRISVLDRGMGVPAGEERKIFESFYRAHDSLSSGIQGSGLGLTLALRLAEEHGGKIEYSRREGGGSRFTLSLPLVAEDRHHATGLCGPSDAFPSDSRPPTV